MNNIESPNSSPRCHGTVLLETVFVLPILLFLAYGMVEFGQFLYVRSAFEQAAVDVARLGVPATAQLTDPATAATRTLGYAGVTFNPSWLTIIDYSNSNAVVSDVSQINAGHLLIFTVQTTYSQLPIACRPLSGMTGIGISSTKIVIGQCSMVKE